MQNNSPTVVDARSIRQAFAELKPAGKSPQTPKIGLVPFIPAGYPTLADTAPAIDALDSIGSTVIEIGFPFSDPIADGPVIQEAFTVALARKLKVAEIFAAAASAARPRRTPLVAMVSYSIIFRYGRQKFFADAKAAGFAGLIVPDLPPPEAQAVCQEIRAAGLDTILLVSPTTAPQRRAQIAKLCSGFVYYMSVSGITGERDQLPSDVIENVQQIRQLTDAPICVGFGVGQQKHVRQLLGVADGAIVGTAIVRVMKEHLNDPPEKIAAAVAIFARGLLVG